MYLFLHQITIYIQVLKNCKNMSLGTVYKNVYSLIFFDSIKKLSSHVCSS